MAGPFLSAHFYLQWGGKLPGGESWSNGLRLAPFPVSVAPGFPSLESQADILEAFAARISTFHATANLFNAAAKLQFAKLNRITATGVYQEATTNEFVIANVGGGAGGTPLPNQVACVATLLTPVSRGPANKGRLYLPLPAPTGGVDATTGLVSTEWAGQVEDAVTTLVNGLNTDWAAIAASGITYSVAIMSRKTGNPASQPVTNVKVGRVLDTQRRRRRSLVESYVD